MKMIFSSGVFLCFGSGSGFQISQDPDSDSDKVFIPDLDLDPGTKKRVQKGSKSEKRT